MTRTDLLAVVLGALAAGCGGATTSATTSASATASTSTGASTTTTTTAGTGTTVEADAASAVAEDASAAPTATEDAATAATTEATAGTTAATEAPTSGHADGGAAHHHAAAGTPPAEHPASAAGGAAEGQPVFDRVCGRCHPHGNEDIGPRLTGIGWDEARMHRQIRSGGGSMRAIAESRLPEAQMPALMAYLRSLHAVR